jgi:hypothetical protein
MSMSCSVSSEVAPAGQSPRVGSRSIASQLIAEGGCPSHGTPSASPAAYASTPNLTRAGVERAGGNVTHLLHDMPVGPPTADTFDHHDELSTAHSSNRQTALLRNLRCRRQQKLSRRRHTPGEPSEDTLRQLWTMSQVRAHHCDNRQHVDTNSHGL